MFSLAIFDMAHTTIDDRDEVYRILRESTEREGASYSDEVFTQHMGTEKHWAIGRLLELGGVELNDEVHERAWAWFRAELERTYTSNPPTPIAGVEDMFAALRDKGIKIGLTTGFSREIVDLILSSMGWDDGRIDTTAAGNEVPAGRPEPYLIQKVMADLGITDPAQIISAGDTPADVESARRACVTSVGVLTGHLTRADFEALGADHVLDSAADITTLI